MDERVYDELRRIAASYLGRERADHTLQPTALVHEAFVRLAARSFHDGAHLRATAATAMRRILVDHARSRASDKRGGGRLRVTLAPEVAGADAPDLDVLALDEALEELAEASGRRASVVELRFFGGLTNDEAAEVLGVAPKTTEADWYFARAWLRRRLADGEA